MPRSLVLGMNDHQGSYWVLIVVTSTHRPLAARNGGLATRSHRHKAVLSHVALTLRWWDHVSGVLMRIGASPPFW